MSSNIIRTGHGIRIAVLITVLILLSGGAQALSNSGSGSWAYYKDITISNSGGALSNYQVLVNLTSSNFPTNAQTSDADIRFTDASGAELSYWIESWDYAGRSGKIWVKVPGVAVGASTIRMWYGNPSAGSLSNIRTTFMFGDDFEYTDSVNNHGWTSEANHGGSIGSSTDYAHSGSRSLKSYSLNGLSYVQSTLASGSIANVWFRDQTGQGGNEQAILSFDDGINAIIVGVGTTTSATNYVTRELGTFYPSSLPRSNGWHDLKIVYDGTKYYMYVDDNLLRTSSGGYGTPSQLGLGNFWWLTETFYYDDVRVRKYASSEPTITFGAEQANSGLVGFWSFEGNASDSSGNGNNGTINGGAAFVQGVSGQALSFDGVDDYVNAGNAESLKPATFSIHSKKSGADESAKILPYSSCSGNHELSIL